MNRFFIIMLLLSVCRGIAFCAEPLKAAVAANFVPVMEAIKKEFVKKNPGLDLAVISGSSGKLTAQIMNGADFDIFISADMDFPKKIKESGFGIDDPQVYAVGQLVMVTVRPIDLSEGISAVTNPAARRLVTANPRLAPYGRAAVAALSNAGFLFVTNKMVFTENISQSMAAVMTSVEIGFVGKSLLYMPATQKYNVEGKCYVKVDPKLYPPLEQAMILLKNGKNRETAKALFDYILSPEAQELISHYGYGFASK